MATSDNQSSSKPLLSVVVPVHNEAENIGALVAEISHAMTDFGAFEIIVVNDGSTDETYQVLAQVAQSFPHLTVINHLGNFGQSAALLSGVRAASALWIATLDGDGQNDPADIPGLWRRLQSADPEDALKMIAGHRRDRHDSWVRRVSSKIANGVRGWLLKDGTPDTGCGLKLIERQTFLELPYFEHYHRFFPALVQRAGGRVESVPVGHRPRGGGRSHYGVGNRLWAGIVDLIGVLWLKRRGYVPLERDITILQSSKNEEMPNDD